MTRWPWEKKIAEPDKARFNVDRELTDNEIAKVISDFLIKYFPDFADDPYENLRVQIGLVQVLSIVVAQSVILGRLESDTEETKQKFATMLDNICKYFKDQVDENIVKICS
jgi:hypothetical protein